MTLTCHDCEVMSQEINRDGAMLRFKNMFSQTTEAGIRCFTSTRYELSLESINNVMTYILGK